MRLIDNKGKKCMRGVWFNVVMHTYQSDLYKSANRVYHHQGIVIRDITRILNDIGNDIKR
jgi:hypothetical protein